MPCEVTVLLTNNVLKLQNCFPTFLWLLPVIFGHFKHIHICCQIPHFTTMFHTQMVTLVIHYNMQHYLKKQSHTVPSITALVTHCWSFVLVQGCDTLLAFGNITCIQSKMHMKCAAQYSHNTVHHTSTGFRQLVWKAAGSLPAFTFIKQFKV